MSVDHTLLCAVADALEDADGPDDARTRVARLAARYPTRGLRLTVETEPYDGAASYHVSLGGAASAWSVSRAAPSVLPWPLRGVVRSTDRDLLRVGERVLQVDEAVACLDQVWSDADVARRLVDATLAKQAVEERGIALDDEELQAAVDAFRRGKGLHTAAATADWLDAHGLAPAGLVELARGSALVARLRRQVVAEADPAAILAGEELVQDLSVAWTEPTDDPTVAAFTRNPDSVVAAARAGRHCGVARWRGEEVPPVFAALLTAPVDRVVPVADGRLLARVLARHRPAPDGLDGRRRLERVVFDRWLAVRRAEVTVEWLWGVNAVRPPPVTR